MTPVFVMVVWVLYGRGCDAAKADMTIFDSSGIKAFVIENNPKCANADLILASITQLITVVLADKIKHHECIRSLKPLIA